MLHLLWVVGKAGDVGYRKHNQLLNIHVEKRARIEKNKGEKLYSALPLSTIEGEEPRVIKLQKPQHEKYVSFTVSGFKILPK